MNLEKQVVSLELAQRLKELGVKQNAYFSWYKQSNFGNEYILSISGETNIENYSAFTSAEVGELLEKDVTYKFKNTGDEWYLCDNCENSTGADTEADARAKMLIYLIENNLIKLEDINV
jgi:hypothetical protein